MNITTTTKLVERINVNGNVQFENIYYVDMFMSLIITTNQKQTKLFFNLNEMTNELTSKVWIFTLTI
jgi:hypothetical protein